jgi:hypothetical protein
MEVAAAAVAAAAAAAAGEFFVYWSKNESGIFNTLDNVPLLLLEWENIWACDNSGDANVD